MLSRVLLQLPRVCWGLLIYTSFGPSVWEITPPKQRGCRVSHATDNLLSSHADPHLRAGVFDTFRKSIRKQIADERGNRGDPPPKKQSCQGHKHGKTWGMHIHSFDGFMLHTYMFLRNFSETCTGMSFRYSTVLHNSSLGTVQFKEDRAHNTSWTTRDKKNATKLVNFGSVGWSDCISQIIAKYPMTSLASSGCSSPI